MGIPRQLARLASLFSYGGLLGEYRNKIINGGCGISQRGASFTVPAGGSAYTADRWRIANTTNQPLTVQVSTFAYDGSPKHPRLRLSFATAPTSGDVFVTQRIEGADTLAGKLVTMSFLHSAGEAIAAAGYLAQNFGSGGSAAVAASPAEQAVAMSTGVAIAKLGFTLPSTAGATFGTGDFLEWVIRIPVRSTNPVTISRCSLVAGDATGEADPFSPRQPQQELALCQRYYEQVYNAFSSNISASTGYTSDSNWRVPKRTTPTVALVSGNLVGNGSVGARAGTAQSNLAISVSASATATVNSGGWRDVWAGDAEL